MSSGRSSGPALPLGPLSTQSVYRAKDYIATNTAQGLWDEWWASESIELRSMAKSKQRGKSSQYLHSSRKVLHNTKWPFRNIQCEYLLTLHSGRVTLLSRNSPFSTSVVRCNTRFRSVGPDLYLKILSFVHLSWSKLFSRYDDVAYSLHSFPYYPMLNSCLFLFSQIPVSPTMESWVYRSISTRFSHYLQIARKVTFKQMHVVEKHMHIIQT